MFSPGGDEAKVIGVLVGIASVQSIIMSDINKLTYHFSPVPKTVISTFF